MILAAMLAVAMIAVAPALAQDDPAVVADAKAKTATAGGAKGEAECKDGGIEAPAPAPAPAPKMEEKKELPKTGGSGTASLFALGAGALLVAGGLVARRIV